MAAVPTFLDASGDVVPEGSQTTLYGWTARESASAVATVNFRTGGATGPIVAVVSLAADAGTAHRCDGIVCRDGLYLEVATGAVEVVTYWQ